MKNSENVSDSEFYIRMQYDEKAIAGVCQLKIPGFLSVKLNFDGNKSLSIVKAVI